MYWLINLISIIGLSCFAICFIIILRIVLKLSNLEKQAKLNKKNSEDAEIINEILQLRKQVENLKEIIDITLNQKYQVLFDKIEYLRRKVMKIVNQIESKLK